MGLQAIADAEAIARSSVIRALAPASDVVASGAVSAADVGDCDGDVTDVRRADRDDAGLPEEPAQDEAVGEGR